MGNSEESNPLLSKQQETGAEKKEAEPASPPPSAAEGAKKSPSPPLAGSGGAWTADGVPLGHGSVVGEPMRRSQWDSSLIGCLGRNDEFCSSDLEVCLLGSVAPCMLYGSTVERLAGIPGTFASHCLPYSALYLMGECFVGGNCLAPWFSYPTRMAIRRKFNLEGSCEALGRSCGCCQSLVEDDEQRERCESGCDLFTHVFCHACALCQEAREVRRRLPHPGFKAQPFLVMAPPQEQVMGRGGA